MATHLVTSSSALQPEDWSRKVSTNPCESNSKPILDESIRTANWLGSTHSKRQHGIDQSKLISLCCA